MKHYSIVYLFLLLATIYSCSDKNSLFKDYHCKTKQLKLVAIHDALQKFKLNIPNNWKTELYIDKNNSIFVTADTTKQLSKTFIIKLSYITGAINFNKNSATTLKQRLAKDFWKTYKTSKGFFNGYPALLLYSENQQLKIKTSSLHIFFNANKQYHFEIEIQCFGNKNKQERFCKAITIIKTLKLS